MFSPRGLAHELHEPEPGETIEFGRASDGPGELDDPRLSRRHARLGRDAENHLFIEDLGGTNGTFVDGTRVKDKLRLKNDAVVSMGDCLFVVDVEPKRDALPAAPDTSADVPEVTGISMAAERHRLALATAAPKGHVILLGPSGSGKEVSAQAIHRLSGRTGALVVVNSAALPEQLADSMLFGHEKGAFTGADTTQPGRIVEADQGTLFLDEVADLSEPVQAKLLRVLEDGLVMPLGGHTARSVDVRVVAATHKALEASGFRRDLYARLGDWVLKLPPLADHRADILWLWRMLGPADELRCSAEFAEALLLHDWPLNVRELKKLAHRVHTLAGPNAELDLDLLPEPMQRPLLGRIPDDIEGEYDGPDRAILQDALQKSKGNVKQAALDHGWHRTQLYRWLKRAGVDPKQYR